MPWLRRKRGHCQKKGYYPLLQSPLPGRDLGCQQVYTSACSSSPLCSHEELQKEDFGMFPSVGSNHFLGQEFSAWGWCQCFLLPPRQMMCLGQHREDRFFLIALLNFWTIISESLGSDNWKCTSLLHSLFFKVASLSRSTVLSPFHMFLTPSD